MDFILIPPGAFTMGSPANEPKRTADEAGHPVEITKHFHIGRYEVTQQQYEAVMETNPSFFSQQGEGKGRGSTGRYQ